MNQPRSPAGLDISQCRSLYVGGLSPKITEALLYEIFSTVAVVESCKLIKDKTSGSCAGYGFVDYYDNASASLAISALAGKVIYGSEIKVNWAYQGAHKEDTGSHYHVFVGDLSPDIDDKGLYSAFIPYGSVSEARVMWDQHTGRSRGYGFVAFRIKTDAERAITEMNGEVLGGRAVRCNWANQKQGVPSYTSSSSSSSGSSSNGSSNGSSGSSGSGLISTLPLVSTPPTPVVAAPAASQARYIDVAGAAASAPAVASDDNTTVYVGNVAADVSDSMLRGIFGEYGQVEEVRLQRDKGFAFVRFAAHESAASAIAGLHSRPIGSRVVKCSWGKERAGGGTTTKAIATPTVPAPSPSHYPPGPYGAYQPPYHPAPYSTPYPQMPYGGYAPAAYAPYGAPPGYPPYPHQAQPVYSSQPYPTYAYNQNGYQNGYSQGAYNQSGYSHSAAYNQNGYSGYSGGST